MKRSRIVFVALLVATLLGSCDIIQGFLRDPSGQLPAPGNVLATAGDGQVTISWSEVAGADGYTVYRKAGPGVSRDSNDGATSASSNSVVLDGLVNGTEYSFVVHAKKGQELGLASAVILATPAVGAPGTPTNLVATEGDGQVSLAWTAVTGSDSYVVYCKTGSSVTKDSFDAAVTAYGPDIVVGGLLNGTQYSFVVHAVRESVSGAASQVVRATPHSQAAATIKIGFVTDVSGIDDAAFSAKTWGGILQYATENGLAVGTDVKYLESAMSADFAPNLRSLAVDGMDLVVAAGFMFTDAISTVAGEYPGTDFLLIDAVPATIPANLACATFATNESSYLAGLAAGLRALKDGKSMVGVIGGQNLPVVNEFIAGYQEGVAAIFPECAVLIDYAGTFNDPVLGQSLAAAQYDTGADVIFNVAGATGAGIIDEAVARSATSGTIYWAIGVDRNQYLDGYLPDTKSAVLTSAVKKVDVVAHDMALREAAGTFPGGETVLYDLASGGAGLPGTNPSLSANTLSIIQDHTNKIVSGAIVVGTDVLAIGTIAGTCHDYYFVENSTASLPTDPAGIPLSAVVVDPPIMGRSLFLADYHGDYAINRVPAGTYGVAPLFYPQKVATITVKTGKIATVDLHYDGMYGVQYAYLNTTDTTTPLNLKTTRQALGYGVDRDAIASAVSAVTEANGTGSRYRLSNFINVPILQDTPLEGMDVFAYDPVQSAALLAGTTLLPFTVLSNTGIENDAVCAEVAADLSVAAGVSVIVTSVGTLDEKNALMQAQEFEVGRGGWTLWDTTNYHLPLLEQLFRSDDVKNYSKAGGAALDTLFDQAAANLAAGDAVAFVADLIAINNYLVDEVPVIPLYFSP